MFKRILVICVILLASANAWALPIVAGDTVTMLNDWAVPYTMKASNGSEFQTFCLESHNYFNPGYSYKVASVGDYAEGGGGGSVNGKDQVSAETKWLYAAYMSGVFNSIVNAASEVQWAIWHLESEIGGQYSSWDKLNDFRFDATGWNVVAVNITRNGADNQSQLVGESAPVPEPATMFLLGSGLIGLIGSRRKKK